MTPIDPTLFGPLEPDADGILIYYDGPLLYTTGDESFLWYWVDCDPERYLVTPTDPTTIAALEANTLDIRSAVLEGGRLYLAAWRWVGSEAVLDAWELTSAEVEPDWVAVPGVTLRPDGEVRP
jgi:hypothetical protein